MNRSENFFKFTRIFVKQVTTLARKASLGGWRQNRALRWQYSGLSLGLASLSLLFATCVFSETVELQKTGNVEQIKDYLTRRPAVAIAVIQTRNDLLDSTAAKYIMYQGAWQDDNVYVRQVVVDSNENECFSSNTVFAVGKSGLNVWQSGHAGALSGPVFIVQTLQALEEAPSFFRVEATTNRIVAFASNLGGQFRRFLDFGLIDVKSGTLEFVGNNFKAQSIRGKMAEGELLTKNGIVTAIKYQFVGDTVYVISDLVYETNAVAPSYLPTKVCQKVYDERGTLIRTNMAFDFIRIKLAGEPLDKNYFLPDRFDESKRNQRGKVFHLELTNGATFLQSNGEKKKLTSR